MTQEKRILELALLFAEIHIGDTDCLGQAANELFELIEREYPNIKRAEDIDC